MAIEVLYDPSKLPQCDLLGIVTSENKICGIINNCPGRREPVPFQTIDLFAGDDRQLRLLVKNGELQIIELDGAAKAVFTVKLRADDATPVFTKDTDVSGEGMIGAADEGEAFFFIVPADTASLTVCQYVWDVRVTLDDGKTYTVARGLLNLLEPVG
jgi:hypothetical protein